jgi:hypothetical protein
VRNALLDAIVESAVWAVFIAAAAAFLAWLYEVPEPVAP